MKRGFFLGILALLCATAFAQAKTPIDKVSVLANGELFLNGHPTTLVALDRAFHVLANKHGSVWYYRQNTQDDPPPDARGVIKLVVKYQLAISLSSKPDFSDYIGVDGQSHARKP